MGKIVKSGTIMGKIVKSGTIMGKIVQNLELFVCESQDREVISFLCRSTNNPISMGGGAGVSPLCFLVLT